MLQYIHCATHNDVLGTRLLVFLCPVTLSTVVRLFEFHFKCFNMDKIQVTLPGNDSVDVYPFLRDESEKTR